MAAVVRSLQPVIERVVVGFRQRLDEILSELTTDDPEHEGAPARRPTQLGRPKRCSVCRLEGTRNDAALPRAHTQEEHQRFREAASAEPATPGSRRRGMRDAA